MRRTTPPLARPEPGGFVWATGIEDTFIADPHRTTGRILDEYALTEHYTRWEEDLRLIADLGVQAARYGIPWYRVCPRPGEYDWTWADRALDTMVNTHHVEPIIDLVHYGTPLWMEGSFFHPDYPRYVADYAHAFAEHYRGLCRWYTPLNEPRINAWYAGRLGWWPPYGRSWQGFARVLLQLCRGICLTQQALRQAEPQAVLLHVDATDLYIPLDPTDAGLMQEAKVRQDLVFLALDLVTGRFTPEHPLHAWLRQHGGTEADTGWFSAHAVTPDIIGYNMYPMFSRKIVRRAPSGGVRVVIKPCWAETLAELTRMYASRYAPIPVLVSETACSGAVPRRIRWIEDSVRVVQQAREEGVRVVGYTFWPLFSLITWGYRHGRAEVGRYLLDMGLWDLRPGPNGLERVRTPVVEAYRQAVTAGI